MTKDEALKLAMEAMEITGGFDVEINAIKEALAQPEHGWTPERIAGIARLKDAQDKRLAQQEQEPVTWRYKIVDVFGRPVWTLKTPRSDTRVLESQPLYTTPPQRKPLADAMEYDLDWCDEAAAELRRMHDLLGKANALCRIRAEEIERLKAQSEQEPVAKMGMYEHKCPNVTGHRGPSFVCQKAGHGVGQNSYCKGCTCPEALNTSPSAQRKPLTDEEIDEISKKHIAEGTRSFEVFARAIEAAHGIKELV